MLLEFELHCHSGTVLHEDPMRVEMDLLSRPSSPVTRDENTMISPLAAERPMSAPPSPDSRPAQDCISLEVVRFEVQGEDSVCGDSALRNVTVARRTRAALPLHIFSECSTPVAEAVVNFANNVCKEAPEPVLQASPPRRRSKQQEQVFTIRRSVRLAKKSRHRATKPAVQAQNVFMKKLGLTSDKCPPDATSYQRFTDTFSSTLTTSHCDALDALLPSGLGSVFTEQEAPVLVS